MTTKKDVERALNFSNKMLKEYEKYEKVALDRSTTKTLIPLYKTIKQALQEKLDRFGTIEEVEYIHELVTAFEE